jgi:hypothetical protein
MFEINNDLGNIKYKSWHNWFHFCASILFTIIIYKIMTTPKIGDAALGAWCIGILWDLGDGIKPWHYDFKYNNNQASWLNWLRQNLLYSDKFSLQDVFVWDLSGCIIGAILLSIIA